MLPSADAAIARAGDFIVRATASPRFLKAGMYLEFVADVAEDGTTTVLGLVMILGAALSWAGNYNRGARSPTAGW